MRQLVRWSDSSLRVTTPNPCQGEPSRCMTLSRLSHMRLSRLPLRLSQVLEVTAVDHFEARHIGDLIEPAPCRYHGGGRLRSHVAVGKQAESLGIELLDAAHARDRRKPIVQSLPVGLDLHGKTAAQHLAPQ